MTAETKKEEETKPKEITFECKFCKNFKSLDEMVVITRYFPPVVACRDCERKTR